MAKRTSTDFNIPTGTVIGQGFTIQSTRLTSADAESMRVDGTVEGNIEINGVLNLSETGRIDGDVIAMAARIAGRVTGNLTCRNALHVTATADILGDIMTDTLIIDKGAVLKGRCQTTQAANSQLLSSSATENKY